MVRRPLKTSSWGEDGSAEVVAEVEEGGLGSDVEGSAST